MVRETEGIEMTDEYLTRDVMEERYPGMKRARLLDEQLSNPALPAGHSIEVNWTPIGNGTHEHPCLMDIGADSLGRIWAYSSSSDGKRRITLLST